MCVWVWLYSIMWAMFPILGWGRYGPEPFGISCSLAWGQMKDEGFSFVVTIFSLNLAVPAVIIICCYFGIAIKLYFTYKKTINTNQIPVIIKLHRRLLIVRDFVPMMNVVTIFVLLSGKIDKTACVNSHSTWLTVHTLADMDVIAAFYKWS